MILSPNSGNLLHNLILFGRLLRALGLDVNPGRVIDLVQALEHVDLGREPDFYFTARSLMVHEKDDLPIFDEAFARFWRDPSAGAEIPQGQRLDPQRPPAPQVLTLPLPEEPQEQPVPTSAESDDLQEVIEVTRRFSQQEVLRQKDFSALTAEEYEAVRRMMAQLVWDLGMRRTRRRRSGRLGRDVDVRRLFRQNLRYGGELFEWPRRELKVKPRPLIILADISGSMEQYARLLLHFVYSLSKGLSQDVEAFVFSTRLTRITRQLHSRDLDQALGDVAKEVVDWSGGTRIGEAVKTFNFEWGRRVLGRGAVVLLISDGWDRGDPDLLHAEMGRLHRTCHRLIWLNPLLGSARYEPLTRGMQAALPFIDDFLPVHNLVSLEHLADHLALLTAGSRPRGRASMPLDGAAFVGGGRG